MQGANLMPRQRLGSTGCMPRRVCGMPCLLYAGTRCTPCALVWENCEDGAHLIGCNALGVDDLLA